MYSSEYIILKQFTHSRMSRLQISLAIELSIARRARKPSFHSPFKRRFRIEQAFSPLAAKPIALLVNTWASPPLELMWTIFGHLDM
jgi:hypothetical protein